MIHIQVEITLGKYQEPLLNLEKKLESGLYCELVSKELHDTYVEYVLFYDMIANRISINEVVAQNGSLKLMESFYWEYEDRKSTRLNSSHVAISYAVFCLKKKN